MNKTLPVVVIMLATLLLSGKAMAQMVGIGVDVPSATLDVRSTNAYSAIHVLRSLTPSVSNLASVEINDDSDHGALDVFYSNSGATTGIGAYVEASGTGTAFYATNTNTANFNPVARIRQQGLGDGVMVELVNGSYGIQVRTFKDSQSAIHTNHAGNDSWAMFNYLAGGVGIYNLHSAPSWNSFYTDLSDFGSLPNPFYNVAFVGYMDGSDGHGFYYSNTNSDTLLSGNGYGFYGYAKTRTSNGGGVFRGDQFGVGHGISIDHHGLTGRTAEFNTLSQNNNDPTVFISHKGDGSAILVENQNNNASGIIRVVDAAYTGTAKENHIALFGQSIPDTCCGVGVYGEGGYFGVYAAGDLGASGVKTFVIDHPLDPANMLLRHFSMESDQVLNVYQGTASIKKSGKVRIELPAYFQTINRNYSYQLTAIGTPVQPWVYEEITDNAFTVAGKPGSRVSWMVIAHRNDAYVKANPHKTRAELPKMDTHKGKYLDPSSHGLPLIKGIYFKDRSGNTISVPPKGAGQRHPLQLDKSEVAGDMQQNQVSPEIPSRSGRTIGVGPDLPRMEIRREIKTWDEIR